MAILHAAPRPPAPVVEDRPVRILVVDDSAYMRFTISKHLNETAGMTVVGAARDGQEALGLIPQLQPDVITLDVEMPRLDGLSTLRRIMADFPRPVIMLSSLTTEGARETIQALTLGAVDCVAKPSAKVNINVVMDEVTAKVRAAAQARVRPVIEPAAPAPFIEAVQPRQPGRKHTRPMRSQDKLVIIGASTGGPRALNTVVPALPADLPAAFLIVQHMPVGFTRSLAERLDQVSSLAVKEASVGDSLEVGAALVAPGGFHMTVDNTGRVALNQNPTVHGVRPAIDVTMTSVAGHYKNSVVAVVLTGMGRDGATGSTLIHQAGGKVITEDESTCVVWGMPRSVAETGMADAIVPLPDVAAAIEKAVKGS